MFSRSEQREKKILNVIERRQPELTVVIENVHDPHNVSAVIRSCDAVGVYEVYLVYYGGQTFPSLGEKSSASARKWVNLKKFNTISECYSQLRQEGKKIYTTHMGIDSVSLYDLNLSQPVALVFGNEHAGVSEEAVKLADGNFLIPQVGMIQSLNISVAAAVSLYEAFRQRMAAGKYNSPQFVTEKLKTIYNEWLLR